MSNDKANAAYHGRNPEARPRRSGKTHQTSEERYAEPTSGFRDQGWGDPRTMGEHPPLTAEEALARRAASGSRWDQPVAQEGPARDMYAWAVAVVASGAAGFLLGAVLF